jgi:DHA2 family multidrug resistance protein
MGAIMNFILGLVLFGTVFIFPLFVQISLGWTATQTGVFMIPGALCTAFAMPLVARILGTGINPKIVIMTGVLITFTFVFMLSSSSPDSSERNFYLPFVLRGFGMAFMMSPILSLSVAGLRGKDMAQAIGLSNMVRQLGGSVGIALIKVAERLQMLTQNYISKGFSPVEAEAAANRAMDGLLTKQQMIVSYDQGFFMVSMLVLVFIPVVLLIRTKKNAEVVTDAH